MSSEVRRYVGFVLALLLGVIALPAAHHAFERWASRDDPLFNAGTQHRSVILSRLAGFTAEADRPIVLVGTSMVAEGFGTCGRPNITKSAVYLMSTSEAAGLVARMFEPDQSTELVLIDLGILAHRDFEQPELDFATKVALRFRSDSFLAALNGIGRHNCAPRRPRATADIAYSADELRARYLRIAAGIDPEAVEGNFRLLLSTLGSLCAQRPLEIGFVLLPNLQISELQTASTAMLSEQAGRLNDLIAEADLACKTHSVFLTVPEAPELAQYNADPRWWYDPIHFHPTYGDVLLDEILDVTRADILPK